MQSTLPYTRSVMNQKGGVGKTTAVTNAAVGLGKKGKRVLLIDTDPQCNTSKFMLDDPEAFYLPPADWPVDQVWSTKDKTYYRTLIDRKPLPIVKTRYENVDLVPSDFGLVDTDITLAAVRDHREARLRSALEQVKGNYDEILIDNPPNLSLITINSLCASDRLIVIVETDLFSLEGIAQLSETFKFIREEYGHEIELGGFLLNKVQPNTKAFTMTKTKLEKSFGDKVYRSYLPYRTEVRNAQFDRQSMYERGENDFTKALNYFILDEFGI